MKKLHPEFAIIIAKDDPNNRGSKGQFPVFFDLQTFVENKAQLQNFAVLIPENLDYKTYCDYIEFLSTNKIPENVFKNMKKFSRNEDIYKGYLNYQENEK